MSDSTNPSSAPTSLTRRLSRKLSLSFGRARRSSNASRRTPSPPASSSPPGDSYFHPSQMVPPVPTIALSRVDTRRPRTASPRLDADAHAHVHRAAPGYETGAVLRRKSTRRERREEQEDQSFQPEWRERERAKAGFFDAQQTGKQRDPPPLRRTLSLITC